LIFPEGELSSEKLIQGDYDGTRTEEQDEEDDSTEKPSEKKGQAESQEVRR